ncbi:lysine-specific demethylase 3A-like isoform X2 [Lingula anatina]|nr:lysine-specific demethylase 3A-like isoform X2 [Lingula anatina]|eukprot:XP_023930882.1 lysine-specific demethylase 3A-like isoform X2 [Lingula anatina]
MIAGFSHPSDAEVDDIAPWMPQTPVIHPRLDVETALYIITRVGDKFCELVMQEQAAMSWAGEHQDKIAWKRQVQGVREMCDVCDTTLFNMHWVCQKCGFVVCLDCYKVKKDNAVSEYDMEEESKEGDEHNWLTCSSNRQPHDPDKLMLTQIIPGDALWEVGRLIHEVRPKWSIPVYCPCGAGDDLVLPPKNGVSQQLLHAVNNCISPEGKKLVNGFGHNGGHNHHGKKLSSSYPDGLLNSKDALSNGPLSQSMNSVGSKGMAGGNIDPLSLLADVASMDSEKNKGQNKQESLNKIREKKNASDFPSYQETKAYTLNAPAINSAQIGKNLPANLEAGLVCGPECTGDHKGHHNADNCSTLKMLLTKRAKMNNSSVVGDGKMYTSTLSEIIQSVVEKNLPREDAKLMDGTTPSPLKLMHYIPKNGSAPMSGREAPIPVHNLTETSLLYPDVPHTWLCDGRLLRLHDPRHANNLQLFQDQWRLGLPVMVSGLEKLLNMDLWKPETFAKEFGHLENDLVNCLTGVVIVGQKMKAFWEGFEVCRERLLDDDDEPMVMKLKDWPPGEDFSDLLPTRFQDLMQALPVPEYTHRTGRLNLASRLPDFFVRPDLGPKMYNAYGLAHKTETGTTNLHLDVSDAVNVMMYVGIPVDDKEEYERAIRAINEAGADLLTKRRVVEMKEKPGALWHIYDAQDADKIRDFLNKVAKETGEAIEPDHDPIHDQSWYLNKELRERLLKEYGVQGHCIVQCLGDAIFIPGGAPHQVQNLHSCIKVAEDFVSPEHLNHCFKLTQEFRHLSDTHSNHEDKLQVKNIIFHAVKDAVAVLHENDPKDYLGKR